MTRLEPSFSSSILIPSLSSSALFVRLMVCHQIGLNSWRLRLDLANESNESMDFSKDDIREQRIYSELVGDAECLASQLDRYQVLVPLSDDRHRHR